VIDLLSKNYLGIRNWSFFFSADTCML
jgi:hypothetical protein